MKACAKKILLQLMQLACCTFILNMWNVMITWHMPIVQSDELNQQNHEMWKTERPHKNWRYWKSSQAVHEYAGNHTRQMHEIMNLVICFVLGSLFDEIIIWMMLLGLSRVICNPEFIYLKQTYNSRTFQRQVRDILYILPGHIKCRAELKLLHFGDTKHQCTSSTTRLKWKMSEIHLYTCTTDFTQISYQSMQEVEHVGSNM